jgi:hypothetical protein
MTFEDAETVTGSEGTPEGAGETQESSESSDATSASESSSSSTPSAEDSASTAPSVDWTTIDAEELYKHRPELKPKTAEEIKAELLASEEVKRQIQSEKDKEIAKEKRRLAKEARERDRQEALRKAAIEKQRLREEEDYEGLGKLYADEEREAKEAGETWIRENPEYVSALGEDRVDEIIESVKSRRGNFYELQFELGKALADKRVADTTGNLEKSITDRVNEAVEAALASAGVQKRTEDAEKGEAAVESVAVGGSPRTSSEKMDYKRSAELYGLGLRSWEEHKPFFEQHQKERNN